MQLENIGFGRMNWDRLFSTAALPSRLLQQRSTPRGAAGRSGAVQFSALHCPGSLSAFAHASISDWKRRYLEPCEGCRLREGCGGFFAWYPAQKGSHRGAGVKLRYLIPSVLAAGFLPANSVAVAALPRDARRKEPLSVPRLQDHQKYYLAAHRSHSSHGSHGSHGSHRLGRRRRLPAAISALSPQLYGHAAVLDPSGAAAGPADASRQHREVQGDRHAAPKLPVPFSGTILAPSTARLARRPPPPSANSRSNGVFRSPAQ